MVKTNPAHVLTDARARGLSWRQIVEALRALTESTSLDPQGRPWIEVAAQLSGYTTNQLRQAQRTYAAIEAFIREQDLPDHGLEWPMSNLEVISRIAKANPQRAERLLISTSLISLRELSKLYDELKDDPNSQISAMSAGHSSARAFSENLHNALSSGQILHDLLAHDGKESTPSLKPWPGRYSFAHPDFVAAYHKDGVLRLAAFEGLRFFGDINLHAATKAAVKAAVEATFFDRYFWCLSEWTPIENLLGMRDQLGLTNVGILSTKSGIVEVLSAPSGGPIPDRQNMLLQDQYLRKRLNVGAATSAE
jgi:hypothetical protein